MGNHISMSQGTSKWFKTIKKSSVAYFFAKFVVPILTSGGWTGRTSPSIAMPMRMMF